MNIDHVHECEVIHFVGAVAISCKTQYSTYTHTHVYYSTYTSIYRDDHLTRFLHIAVPLCNLMDAGMTNVL